MTNSPAVTIDIVVVPNARRNAVEPGDDGLLRVRVAAPAVDGKANEAVCRLVAETFGLRQRDVQIFRGERSRRKTLTVTGLTSAEFQARLDALVTSCKSSV